MLKVGTYQSNQAKDKEGSTCSQVYFTMVLVLLDIVLFEQNTKKETSSLQLRGSNSVSGAQSAAVKI